MSSRRKTMNRYLLNSKIKSNMKRKDAQTASGLSLPVVVFVVFLTLRLAGVISWSWWWVTSPLWIVAAIIVAITILYVAVFTYRYRKCKRN